jgi:hypothetical protein
MIFMGRPLEITVAGLIGMAVGASAIKGFEYAVKSGVEAGITNALGESQVQKAQVAEEQTVYDKNEAPRFSGFSNHYVEFRDNFAPGMRGEYTVDGARTPWLNLTLDYVDQNRSRFDLPSEKLGTDSRFRVRAIDRDKNVSKTVTLFTVEGVVVDSKPPK